MPRLATLISLLVLAFPGAAFAQGAGDDQYQDPFGDQPVQNGGGGSGDSGDGGLSDTPPGGGSGGGGGSGSAPSSGGGATEPDVAGGEGTTAPEAPAGDTAPEADEQAPGELPNTGTDPRLLMLLGSALVLTGVGLRLRTIDPNAF